MYERPSWLNSNYKKRIEGWPFLRLLRTLLSTFSASVLFFTQYPLGVSVTLSSSRLWLEMCGEQKSGAPLGSSGRGSRWIWDSGWWQRTLKSNFAKNCLRTRPSVRQSIPPCCISSYCVLYDDVWDISPVGIYEQYLAISRAPNINMSRWSIFNYTKYLSKIPTGEISEE